jgi:GT2 family glycosyltransferase
MKRQPLTSVLVPCWNALSFLKIGLDRLVLATTRPYELILIDDGSTDGTWDWLKAWRRRARSGTLRNVILRRNRRNRGYPGSMNQAIGVSKGGFLVFANADAVPARGWLEEMTSQFSRRRRLGGLAPCANPPAPLSLRAPWKVPSWYDDLSSMDLFAAACALRPGRKAFIPASGFVPGFWFMTSRRIIKEVGLFDERFSPGGYEDWDLQARIRRSGRELGFAGRAYAHHVWSGVYRRNGRSGDAFYRKNKPLLDAKNPETRGWSLSLQSPY